MTENPSELFFGNERWRSMPPHVRKLWWEFSPPGSHTPAPEAAMRLLHALAACRDLRAKAKTDEQGLASG